MDVKKKPAKTIFGIKVKKETTIANLMGLLVTPLVAIAAGSYINAMMPYLLQDEAYFGIEFANVGSKAGEVIFWAYLLSTLVTPFMGYVYDILGRFWFIVPSCFFLSLMIAIVPLSSPHFWLLCAFRSIMSMLINVIHVNPLIIDYVKTESRGLVMSFASLGIVFGELVMVLMFSMTRGLEISAQYTYPAFIISSMALTLIFLVREPVIKEKKPELPAGSDLEGNNENGS